MKIKLKEVWDKDEDLQEFLQNICLLSDAIRGPAFDRDKSTNYVFSLLTSFVDKHGAHLIKLNELMKESQCVEVENVLAND